MPRPRKGATVYQHRQKWYCRFTSGGRQHITSVGSAEAYSREDAERAARKIEQKFLNQATEAHRRKYSSTPFASFERHLANRTDGYASKCALYKIRFDQFFKGRDIYTLTREDIEEWRDWLLKCRRLDKKSGTLSGKTVKEHIDYVAAVYNRAGLSNPCRGVERPKKSHAERADALEYFTHDEMKALFRVCRERHPAYLNAFTVYAYTGCRASEVQLLKPSDLDRRQHIVWITRKGSKRQGLKLTGPVAPAWNALIAQAKGKEEDEYLFPQGVTWSRKMMEKLSKAAFDGRKHGHPHMLRHTLASMALMHFKPAWSIEYLAKWLGHSAIAITYKTYAHWVAIEPPSSYNEETRTGFNTIKKPRARNSV